MPGIKSVYTARTADVCVKYADDHEWCQLELWLPTSSALAVIADFRGGGGISQPAIWDHGWFPSEEAADKAYIDQLMDAGIAYARVEYPNFPHADVNSRHWPNVRSPHSWRIARKAIQFMQTNALNGKITGTRSRTLPQNYTGYVASGTSMGAYIAAQIALASDGMSAYEDTLSLSLGDKTMRASGRVKGAICTDLPGVFTIYDDSISGDGIQFFGASENFTPDIVNANTTAAAQNDIVQKWNRWSNIPKEAKESIGLVGHINANSSENRHIGLFLNGPVSAEEGSYLTSGLTIIATGYSVVGSLSAASSITTPVAGKGGTVKLAVEQNSTLYVYVEPNSATNSGMPDSSVTDDWTGALTVKDASGVTVATVTSGAYIASGSDVYKTFLTRSSAVSTAISSDLDSFSSLQTAHPITSAAIIKYYRDLVFARNGQTSLDRFYGGSHYPAQISGDTSGFNFDASLVYGDEVMDWIRTDLGIDV